jgi:hypothetical protein
MVVHPAGAFGFDPVAFAASLDPGIVMVGHFVRNAEKQEKKSIIGVGQSDLKRHKAPSQFLENQPILTITLF